VVVLILSGVVAGYILFSLLQPSFKSPSVFTTKSEPSPVAKSNPELVFVDEEEEEQEEDVFDNEDVHIVFSTGCNLFQHWR
jgi:hypothetical protein